MTQNTLDTLIRATVEGLGYELWGYDYRPHTDNGLLRIYIESDNGITVDDCAIVSHQVSAVFDVEDPIPSAYTLEISSPGVDRMLFSPEQYQAYQGKTIKIKTRIPLNNRRNFKGTIEKITDQTVTLKIDHENYEIPFDAIEHSRLKSAI